VKGTSRRYDKLVNSAGQAYDERADFRDLKWDAEVWECSEASIIDLGPDIH
jgi:hypothetical protein